MIALARAPVLRLARSPRAWIPIVLWIAFAIAYATALRVAHSQGSTDRILLGLWAPVVLPLMTLTILGAMTGTEGIRAFVRKVQPFGASGARAALACVLSSAFVCALVSTITAAIVVLVAHGPEDPALGSDLLATIWITALGGATYAAYFTFAGTIGPSGSGRFAVLVLNFLLADAGTAGAVLSPHAQIRSLLGGTQAGALSQRASSVVLVAIFALSTLLCIWRCRRRG